MQTRTSIFPDPGDTPNGYLGGTRADIPVLDLASGQHPTTDLAWHHDLATAAEYFDALAVAAADLATQCRAAATQGERS